LHTPSLIRKFHETRVERFFFRFAALKSAFHPDDQRRNSSSLEDCYRRPLIKGKTYQKTHDESIGDLV